MSNVFFSADLHISHKLVAKHRWDASVLETAKKAHAEVDDNLIDHIVEWHDSILARKWDAVVKPEDQVWVLGDISVGGKKNELNALEWIKARPGEKHLITGNHDSCHPSHRDSHKWQKTYLEAFESVQLAARRKISWHGLKGHNSTDVLLSHLPYTQDRVGEEPRYTQWRLKNEGLPLLHGHTHSVGVLSYEAIPGSVPKDYVLQINVSVDAHEFGPVSLDTITEIIQRSFYDGIW